LQGDDDIWRHEGVATGGIARCIGRRAALTFDATNLTKELYQSYYQHPSMFNFGTALYSRTFALGLRYRF